MSHKPKNLTPETMQMVADRFKVMSDVMRLRILSSLQEGELSVSEVVEKTGASQPNVSKHLKILLASGLVSRRQEGNSALYSIADESIFSLCELVCNSLEERVKTQAQVFETA